jgi:hypothetical protein
MMRTATCQTSYFVKFCPYDRRYLREGRIQLNCPHKGQVNINLKLGENAYELTRAALQEAFRDGAGDFNPNLPVPSETTHGYEMSLTFSLHCPNLFAYFQ